jgi:hypothetical protein
VPVDVYSSTFKQLQANLDELRQSNAALQTQVCVGREHLMLAKNRRLTTTTKTTTNTQHKPKQPQKHNNNNKNNNNTQQQHHQHQQKGRPVLEPRISASATDRHQPAAASAAASRTGRVSCGARRCAGVRGGARCRLSVRLIVCVVC